MKNSANLVMVFHFIHGGHTAQSQTSNPRIPPEEHYKKCESQILTRYVLNYYGELWWMHAQLVKLNTEWRIINHGPKQKSLTQPEYIQYKKFERICTWNKRERRVGEGGIQATKEKQVFLKRKLRSAHQQENNCALKVIQRDEKGRKQCTKWWNRWALYANKPYTKSFSF